MIAANIELVQKISTRREHDFDPTTDCWACNAEGPTVVAHVIPHAIIGEDDHPGNVWRLCDRCHREQPDGAARSAQEAWLLSRELWIDRALRETGEFIQLLRTQTGATDEEISRWSSRIHQAVFATSSGGANKSTNARATWTWAAVQDLSAWLHEQAPRAR